MPGGGSIIADGVAPDEPALPAATELARPALAGFTAAEVAPGPATPLEGTAAAPDAKPAAGVPPAWPAAEVPVPVAGGNEPNADPAETPWEKAGPS
ncbi:hypothetical protein [Mycobacterium kansasii]|uniref:hypothetical protein n=1 Tax=Mycobacterium kansasii TaxID=1768 RepID=UPI001E41FD5E|nr:hypothetical protein [Mycobacterium kansasii]